MILRATRLFSKLIVSSALLLSFAVPASATVTEGEPAPDFSLPGLGDDAPKITLSDFRGSIVYVDFWASWCLPCLRSLPEINTLYERYQDQGFEVIAVTIDNPLEDADDFLEALDVPLAYWIASDIDAEVMDEYGVRGMPTSFLIDRDGIVQKVHLGFREGDTEKLEEALQALLLQ